MQLPLQHILDFISSSKHTFALTGMTKTGKTKLLHQLAENLSKNKIEYIILYPNMRLAGSNGKSIYQHLYSSPLETEKFQSMEQEETASSKTMQLRANLDYKNCIYLLDDAHLLSNTAFTTPDGKRYGSGKLLDDLFQFIDFSGSKRKAIFFGDPYQIQRGDILSQCEDSYVLPLLDIDAPNLLGALKMATHLAHALQQHSFASLPYFPDSKSIAQKDKSIAAQEILSHYQNDEPVWYLTETHEQSMRFSQWLRSKLGLSNFLSIGDWLEIYVWQDDENRTIYSGNLERISVTQPTEEIKQSLKGRDKPISFQLQDITLANKSNNPVLVEFLINEKPELGADIAIAVKAWKNQKEKKEKTEVNLAYVRYGYAATVHHAQGMDRDICYINCAHSAGKHSEGYFRWLYSALTVATEKTILLNFTPVTPFDQAIWKINNQAEQIVEQIAIGTGWMLPENSETDFSNKLKEYLYQIAECCQCRLVHQSSHPYLEKYCVQTGQGEFGLQIAYKGNHRISKWQHNAKEEQYSVLINLAVECVAKSPYTPTQQVLFNHICQNLPDWKPVSVIPENDYRLSIVLMKQWQERIQFTLNFDKQGVVSSVHVHAVTDLDLIDVVREKLS
jgi:hypothetical protein